MKKLCEYCDGVGGTETYMKSARLPIAGKVCTIDHCIHHIVAALNAGNVHTKASCCGHKKVPGRISLYDGTELVIFPKEDDLFGHSLPRGIPKHSEHNRSLWSNLVSLHDRLRSYNSQKDPGDPDSSLGGDN